MSTEIENEETGEIEIIEVEDDLIDDEQWDDEAMDDDASEQTFHSEANLVFSQHNDAVVSCDIDSSGNLIASGGQDDKAYVWNSSDGKIRFECTGHTDTVIFAGFNYDNKLLATADMNGNIKAWSVDSGNQIWSSETPEIVWAEWHHSSNVLLVGTATGDVWLWAVPTSNCKIFPSHGSQAETGKFLADGKRAVIGYADGTIKLLDLKSQKVLHHFKGGDAHDGLVSTVDVFHDNVLAVTGAQDSTAKLINTQSNKIMATLICDSTDEPDSYVGVESVALSPEQPDCATGTLKGLLGIWDLPTHTQKITCDNQAGIVRVMWHPTSSVVYCGCLDGIVRKWDPRNGKQIGQWQVHRNGILDMAISRNGQSIVTASDDKTCSLITS